MDDFDIKILTVMQADSHQTAEHISEQVGLSAPACQRRIKKLRDDGYIEKEIAVASAKATGDHMTFIVQVVLSCHDAKSVQRFQERMQDFPEVQQCYYVTGSADFILLVCAADMEEYEEFTRQAFFSNDNVRGFETNVVMDSVKSGLSVPVINKENKVTR